MSKISDFLTISKETGGLPCGRCHSVQDLADDHLQNSLFKNGSTGEAQLVILIAFAVLISEMKRLNVSVSPWIPDRIDQLGNLVPSSFRGLCFVGFLFCFGFCLSPIGSINFLSIMIENAFLFHCLPDLLL